MSSPTYTYITPNGSPTAGPADPNAPARSKSYAVLSGLMALVPILTAFGLLTGEQGASIGTFVQAAIGLAGSFGLAFAASKTSKQVKNGTFEKAPELPAVSALEQLAILRDQAQNEVDRGVSAVEAGADAMQAAALAAAKAIGVPKAVTGIGNSAFDAVQELIRRAP